MLQVSAKQTTDWQKIIDELAIKLKLQHEAKSENDHQLSIALYKIKDDSQFIQQLELKICY